MPNPTAARVADAALEVLGTGGIHALSHARVDVTAGVPPGTTSNHFRTRAALVAGAIDRLRELDRAAGPPDHPSGLDGLADAFALFVDGATGPLRTRTVARYVIFVQGVVEPALLAALNGDRQLLVDWAGATLAGLGVPGAAEVARTLLAAAEGMIMHRLTGFTAAPAGPEMRRLVTALCA